MSSTETILFGSDPTPGIVAVEAARDVVRLYRRVDGDVLTETRPLRRWMLTTEKHPFDEAQWTELEGDGFRWLAEFANRNAYESARYLIRDAHAESVSYPAAVRQYLVRSGQTLFKGMAFDDPVRMQIDIETLGLNPEPAHNAVFMVTASDNRGLETIIEGDEPSILKQLIALVRERDPGRHRGPQHLRFRPALSRNPRRNARNQARARTRRFRDRIRLEAQLHDRLLLAPATCPCTSRAGT